MVAQNSQSVNGREKLELRFNVPMTFELVYGQPQTGNGKFGEWYRYTVNVGGEEMSWFAPKECVDALAELDAEAGSVVTVTKRDGEGKRPIYEVTVNGSGSKPPTNREGLAAEVEALYGNDAGDGVRSGKAHAAASAQPETPTKSVNGYRAAWKSEEASVERAEQLARLCDGEEWSELLTRYGKLYSAALLVSTEAWMGTGSGFQPQQIGASATTIFLRICETLQAQAQAAKRQSSRKAKKEATA